ncbi:Mobile element protein [Sporomusa ovata]|uniref:Mobile element protein n=1 Tax=Sporomusa ovata TaxID=2378 RepID=A0A0U1L110_9FIRM|nr:Mobile element protein [Sporomusa ovata]
MQASNTAHCLKSMVLFKARAAKEIVGITPVWRNLFFGTLKTELIYHEKYRTRNQARASIFNYNLFPESYEKLRISA